DAALLAILAIDGATARDALASLLWPDVPLKTANTSLRQRVFRLRRRCDSDLVLTGMQLQLAPATTHDVLTIASDESPTDAAALPAGDLLGTLSYADCDALAEWVRAARERWRSHCRHVLAAAAARHERAGELASAIALAQRLVIDDPLLEHAQRRLMRLHYLRGDRAAAIAVFEAFERTLKDELGTRPDPETIELLATIERASVPTAAPARRAMVPPALQRPPRLIGREAELGTLSAAWEAGRVFLLVGEAGMGKSRLLAEFAAGRADVVIAQARPGDVAVPYALLARLLRAAQEAAAQQRMAAAPSTVLDETTRRELARVLPEVGAGMATGGEGQRLLLQRAIERLLMALHSEGISALLVDDLHFSDVASLEMLQALLGAELLSSMQWGLAQRPGEGGPAARVLAQALEETQRLQLVPLPPLDVAAMQALVSSLGVAGIDAAALAGPLVRHTGGNPLFALETLKDMVVAGVTRPAADGLPQPATVGGLIERRLTQLATPALALARVAAIAGIDFSIELAEHVLQTPALALADAWRELESAQILQGAAFAHDLVYDAALRSVPEEIARHVHGAVAQFLASREIEPARVARHWHAARAYRHSGPAFVQAGYRAQAGGRVQEAFDFFRAAEMDLRAAGADDAAFDVLIESQPAALNALAPDALRAWGERVVDAAHGVRQRARALCVKATIANQLGESEAALVASREACELAAAAADRVTALRAARAHAVALLSAGRAAEALAAIEPHISNLDRIEDGAARSELLCDYGLLLERSNRRREALARYAAAADLGRAFNNLVSAQVALANGAVSCVYLGRIDEALERNTQACQLAAEMELDSISRSIDEVNRGSLLVTIGQFGPALDCLERVSAVLRDAAAGFWSIKADLHLATLWIQLGQPGRAGAIAAQVPSPQSPALRAHWLALQLRAARALGQPRTPLVEALDAELAGPGLLARHRLSFELEIAATLPAAAAALRLDRIAAQAREVEHLAYASTALGLRVGALRAASEPVLAADAAERWLALQDDAQAYEAYLPGLLIDAAAALSLRDPPRARALRAQARHWVDIASQSLPPVLRSAYLLRNPMHRQLKQSSWGDAASPAATGAAW
ncbi:MAG: AAA family ATPase, partial [Burkholderiaceae bacterium]|nr:AAA family ATPase [Burkholderiaceae bacterium]